ncbi:hypothetical protein NKW53_03355 [Acetobacter orientalis]|uniref:phage baseplate protein n=1 Tax=Acetobacter orientalis TaxID=146474 RepID=UPI0020A1D517|nr:hypothetical protein [Acetobacter orientalis]MCP1215109.1 hypothetical protein [Acetobacter orientalis]MCP1218692.1 hypothetical protein [Acetobacter orientalis]
MVMQTVAQPVTANVIPGAGVPKLWSTVISDTEAIASVELDTLLQGYLIQHADTQWGLFDSKNQPVVTSGRVRAIDLGEEQSITTAPMEDGSFASVNKCAHPVVIRLEMLCDGTTMTFGSNQGIDNLLAAFDTPGTSAELRARSSFTACLKALVADTNLYHVTTPEQTYRNMNVVGYSMRREPRRGITLLWADVRLQEVRGGAKAIIPHTSVSSGLTTKTPAGAKMVNGGIVNPTPISANSPLNNILKGVL